MPLSLGEADAVARDVLSQVRPLCVKAEIAGDLRLRSTEPISRLVLVCRPHPKSLVALDRLMVRLGSPVRSESSYGILMLDSHLIFPELSRIKIYWCLPGQFGGFLFLHTGPVGFVWRMEKFWRDHGGDRFADGFLWRDGEMLLSESEEEFFGHLGVKPVPPEKRSLPAPVTA